MLIHLKLCSLTLGLTGSHPELMLVYRVWHCWRGVLLRCRQLKVVLIYFHVFPFQFLLPRPLQAVFLSGFSDRVSLMDGLRVFEPQTARRGPHVVAVGLCLAGPKRVSDGQSRPSDCELISAGGGGVFWGEGCCVC